MRFACLYLPPRAFKKATRTREELLSLATEHSPRIEVHGDGLVLLDVDGLEQLWGEAREIGERLRYAAAEKQLGVRVAIASTKTAALLAAQGRCGLTVIPPGTEAERLSTFPLFVLKGLAHEHTHRLLSVIGRWGIKTLGALADLPADELFTRLGQDGVELQRMARGQDTRPLVPAAEEERFEETIALEWPVEGLEPLTFVLGRVLDPLCVRLDARGLAVGMLHVQLTLVTGETHERALRFPAAVSDSRVLRTLVLVDLESHPPWAGIDKVTVRVDPVPARTLQFSLLERAVPSAERISTLMARLTVLMGETRCGSPTLVDTHEPGAFEMRPFVPSVHGSRAVGTPAATEVLVPVLRRFRTPVSVRVTVEHGQPIGVSTNLLRPGGQHHVISCAGPWRTSGQWWTSPASSESWDRDEWDVALSDGGVYRIFRDRDSKQWFLEGVVD